MAVLGGMRRYGAATVQGPLPLLLVAQFLFPMPAQAQAGPRTDTPRAGTFRVTFEPVITTWDRVWTVDGHKQEIAASLPTKVFVHEERRVTPLGIDFGITNRLSVGVWVPLVRVNTREGYPYDSTGKTDRKSTRLNSSHLGISY